MKQFSAQLEVQAVLPLSGPDVIAESDNCPPGQLTSPQYNAEELARIIWEETPESVEAFGSLEEMVEYIQEAMSSDYVFHTKSTPHEVSGLTSIRKNRMGCSRD